MRGVAKGFSIATIIIALIFVVVLSINIVNNNRNNEILINNSGEGLKPSIGLTSKFLEEDLDELSEKYAEDKFKDFTNPQEAAGWGFIVDQAKIEILGTYSLRDGYYVYHKYITFTQEDWTLHIIVLVYSSYIILINGLCFILLFTKKSIKKSQGILYISTLNIVSGVMCLVMNKKRR